MILNTLSEMIRLLGGLEALQERGHVTIENGNLMNLNLEMIGLGPFKRPALSVSHTFLQNGDIMRDPEICFEVVADGPERFDFFPYSVQMDPVGKYFEIYRPDPNTRRPIGVDPEAKQDAADLARLWNRNLRDQGYLRALQAIIEKENNT